MRLRRKLAVITKNSRRAVEPSVLTSQSGLLHDLPESNIAPFGIVGLSACLDIRWCSNAHCDVPRGDISTRFSKLIYLFPLLADHGTKANEGTSHGAGIGAERASAMQRSIAFCG